MGKFILLVIASFLVCGCTTTKSSSGAPPLRSEREYAARGEALAQELYRTGQAPSLQEARAQAAGAMNQEWAAAAKAAEQKQNQETFEEALKKSNKGSQ